MNDTISNNIISMSISKVFGKTSITIVSYGSNVKLPLSNKFILVSKTEENGIYTHTYILETIEDLEKKIERELEDAFIDFYIKSLYGKFFRKNNYFAYRRERIIGSAEALQVKIPEYAIQHASGWILLSDIIGKFGKKEDRFESEKEAVKGRYLFIEYKRGMITEGEMCDGGYSKLEIKRVLVHDYTMYPKFNFKKCKIEKKSFTTKFSDGSITITYKINALCDIHNIISVHIRKRTKMKPLFTQPIKDKEQK